MSENLINRTFRLEKATVDKVELFSSKDEEAGLSKTPIFRIINAMLEMSAETIINKPVDFLEGWEVELAVDALKNHSFDKLEPNTLWTHFLGFNEGLANKVRNLDESEKIWLMLKIIYLRKKTD